MKYALQIFSLDSCLVDRLNPLLIDSHGKIKAPIGRKDK